MFWPKSLLEGESLTSSGCQSLTRVQVALVLKCAADAVFLDDFKTVLDSLSAQQSRRRASSSDRPLPLRRSTDRESGYHHDQFSHEPSKQRQLHPTREWFETGETIRD